MTSGDLRAEHKHTATNREDMLDLLQTYISKIVREQKKIGYLMLTARNFVKDGNKLKLPSFTCQKDQIAVFILRPPGRKLHGVDLK